MNEFNKELFREVAEHLPNYNQGFGMLRKTKNGVDYHCFAGVVVDRLVARGLTAWVPSERYVGGVETIVWGTTMYSDRVDVFGGDLIDFFSKDLHAIALIDEAMTLNDDGQKSFTELAVFVESKLGSVAEIAEYEGD